MSLIQLACNIEKMLELESSQIQIESPSFKDNLIRELCNSIGELSNSIRDISLIQLKSAANELVCSLTHTYILHTYRELFN